MPSGNVGMYITPHAMRECENMYYSPSPKRM